jgi:hypothetical protein
MTGPIKHPPSRILPFRTKVASSKVSTGQKLFVEGGDGRSLWSRRWRDLILSHANDLGGMELLSEAQISLCRRISAMECELEAMEARMSEGQEIDLGLYSRLTALLCRMLDLVGIKRLTRPIDPLSDLAKAFEAYPAKAIDDDDEDTPLPIELGMDREPGEA